MTDTVDRGQTESEARNGDELTSNARLDEATFVAQAATEEEVPVEEEAATEETAAEEAVEEIAEEAAPAPAAPPQILVSKPPAGQTETLAPQGGIVYVMDFDPTLAQVLIQGQDFILLFADGSRIVFDNLVGLAALGQAPFLQVGGTSIGGNVILAQAQALAAEQEGQGPLTLETAAGGEGPSGTGVTEYVDDLGNPVDLLAPEGPIPFTLLEFGTFIGEIEPIDDVLDLALTPPLGTLLTNFGGPVAPGLVVIPPQEIPPEELPPGGTPPDDIPPPPDDIPPGSDPRAFGSGAASSSLSEDTPANALLTAEATSGVLTRVEIRELPTPADGWTVDISTLQNTVEALGGTVDSSGLDNGTVVITFDVGLEVPSLQALIGLTPPTNSDVDFPGVDVIVTATDPGSGTEVTGGTLDITIPVDAIVDGTEIQVLGQTIPANAFIVGDTSSLITDLQLSIDPDDQTSIAGAAADADAPFTQGGADLFDGSEQVTQLVVTLSVADTGLDVPTLNFSLPGGITASSGSGSSSSVTFTVAQGTSFATVQALVDSFTLTRPDADFFGTTTVNIQTTTVETDPEGIEANPDNNVDVDDYSFLVTFTAQPGAQFIIDNALGVIPEDVPTGIRVIANIPPCAPDVVITEIVVTNLPSAATGWVFDPSGIEAFVAGLSGNNSVDFDPDTGTLIITLDTAAGVTDFDQSLLATPPANSDVDFSTLTVNATATNTISGETVNAEPFVANVVVDAVVDGSEVSQAAPVVIATGTTTVTSLGLSLQLGNDSTTGGAEGTSPPDFEAQGGTDVDGSESTARLVVTLTPSFLPPITAADAPELDWNMTILALGSPFVTVTPNATTGGATYEFDTSGLSQVQVEALVASFALTSAPDFVGTVGIQVETNLAEAATVADGGFVSGDQEAFDGDNVDIDLYDFVATYRDGPNGSVEADPNGDGALSEDTLEDVRITADIGTPGDVLTLIRVTGLPIGSVNTQPANTPTAVWIISIDALQLFVAGLPGTGSSVDFNRATGELTITLGPDAGVTSFDQDILMQAPLDSDVDVTGVQILVRAEQGALVDEFTGPPTTIPVDAIVDGSEVTGAPDNAFASPTPSPIDLNLALQLGNDSTTGLVPFESQGSEPNDFSDQGDTSEEVTEIVVTLSEPTAVLVFGALPVGITASSLSGTSASVTFTIDPDLTSIVDATALVASLQVTPAADFFGTIGVLVTTTTVEGNTPEGTVPGSGLEPTPTDNTDVDTYEFDVVVSRRVTGEVSADPDGDGALSEDTLEEVNIFAAVGSPLNGDVLTRIEVTGLPTGSVATQTLNTPTPVWIINIDALTNFVTGLGANNTVDFNRATGTLTITLDPGVNITSFDQDIFMQAPIDSDVDVTGVVISVDAVNGTAMDTFIGDPTTIIVDAIVDGSQVTGSNISVEGDPNDPTPNDLDAIPLGLTLTLGNDSTVGLGSLVPPITPFESQGALPNDFSDLGDASELVTEIVVTLSEPTALLEFGTLPAGVTASSPSGTSNSVTFTITTTDISAVNTLVNSLAVDPPADFDGDIQIDIVTTTTENPATDLETNPLDNTDVDTYSFTLSVDTVPVAQPNDVEVNEAPGTVNLTFVIDYSSSMQTISGTSGLTRLQIEQQAIENLLNLYAQAGSNVNVLLVIFDAEGTVWDNNGPVTSGSGWIINDLAAAIEAVNEIPIDGFGTNYEDALFTAQNAYPDGLPVADRSVLYFTSDGIPTVEGETDGGPFPLGLDHSLTDQQIMDWEEFLILNNLQALAVGIGDEASAADTDLQDVAFPNGDPGNPLIVTDQNLDDLLDTFVELDPGNNFVDGNVLTDPSLSGLVDDFGPDGAGNPSIVSITANVVVPLGASVPPGVVTLVTYTFDGTQITNNAGLPVIAGSVLLVVTSFGGQFNFDFSNGDFLYVAGTVTADVTDEFEYTIAGADGDTDSALLSILVRDQAPPTAVADRVLTNSDPVEIQDTWLTFNDTDPNVGPLSVQRVDDPIGGSVNGGIGETSVSFDFTAAAPTSGSFNYVATDGFNVSANEANVSLDVLAPGSDLTGTAIDEILIGGTGPDNISGNGGNDVLAGNGGVDVLNGGIGNDLLVGGTGADQVFGEAGSDIFQISAGDPGTGVDVFEDFSLTEDVVNLAELLTEFDPGEILGEFVQVSATTNQVSVDQDGSGIAETPQVVAFLATGILATEILTVVTDEDGTQAGVAAV